MELQDTASAYFYKLWPWIETNKVRLIWGGGVVIVAAGLISFFSWQREQKEVVAGQALTQAMLSMSRIATVSQQADLYLKIAADHPGTSGGQRALLEAAVTLYTAGKYADAQAQFQKCLDAYRGSYFAAQAALGVATCLDTQGKTDLAAANYQGIIATYTDAVVVDAARFALAQIDESKGKYSDAQNLYEAITHSSPNSTIGSEAGLRLMTLKQKQPSASPATAPATPVTPNR